MTRITRTFLPALACTLFVLGTLGRAIGVRAPAGARAAATAQHAPALQAVAPLDGAVPFLAASGPLELVPFESVTRGSARTVGRPTATPFDDMHPARAAALRIRAAAADYAAVATMLAVARAGRTELRSTPPPFSVS